MEENIEETTQQPQLVVTEDMRSYIYDIAKWANFLAIVGFVVSGFLILASFTMSAAMQSNAELTAAMSKSGFSFIALTIMCLLYAFAVFYPSLLMFKYANKAKVGVLFGEQASLDEAFSKLKSLFKYWSILTIIGIVLYIMMIVLTAVNGAA
ncbi:MAG: DUF5362 family protein [Bacteroidia bacterium]